MDAEDGRRRLQRLVDDVHGTRDVREVTLGVLDANGGSRLFASAGARDGEAIDERTPYFTASTSKLFATALILQLHAEGGLALDDPLVALLPDVSLVGLHVWKGRDRTAEITVRQLLSHTSGLADYFEDKPRGGTSVYERLTHGVDEVRSLGDILDYVKRDLRPHFPPGRSGRARYSDTNHQLLGGVIERLSGTDLVTAVRERVVEPLGLDDTWLYDPRTAAGERPVLPLRKGRTELHVPNTMGSVRLDGGIVSSAADSLRFIEGFVNGELFPSALLEELQRRWNPIFFPLEAGTGVIRFRTRWYFAPFGLRPTLIGHSGISGAFAFHCPETSRFVAGTVNQLEPRRLPYVLALRAAVLGAGRRGGRGA